MQFNPNKNFNTYTSSGNLSQYDNALVAALNGSICIGSISNNNNSNINLYNNTNSNINLYNNNNTNNNNNNNLYNNNNSGAVLVSYKNLNKLTNKSTYHKVFNICDTIGVTYSGMQPDFMEQLQHAQTYCHEYKEVYGSYPSIETFMQEYAQRMISVSSEGGYRPYGSYMIIAGYSNNINSNLYNNINSNILNNNNILHPMIFYLDPSCSFSTENVLTAGNNYNAVKTYVEKRVINNTYNSNSNLLNNDNTYNSNILNNVSLDDNIQICLNAIKEHVGVEVQPEDVSVGVLRGGKFKVYTEDEIKQLFY